MVVQSKFLNKYLKRINPQCLKFTDHQAPYRLSQMCQGKSLFLREFFISLFVKGHLKNLNLTSFRDRVMYRNEITNNKANDIE